MLVTLVRWKEASTVELLDHEDLEYTEQVVKASLSYLFY